jgi:hypothetical protein
LRTMIVMVLRVKNPQEPHHPKPLDPCAVPIRA